MNLTTDPLFYIVDLFCGFGGTTLGYEEAEIDGNPIAKVIACVNHDPKAIKSHWLNHPGVKHFEEDIRTLDLTELTALVAHYRVLYPSSKLILWASLECTNFSKAKGGQPRDADSRTLADHLDRYIVALDPDYIKIENVVEFMSWGPLDENGKPVSRKNGSDYMRWKNHICTFGYVDEWQELNSANFGAYTSRNRLFGVFAKPWLPIAFPLPTHAKVPSKMGMWGDLE
jgi:DNA (cytosine-5)-methyltransferase 1